MSTNNVPFAGDEFIVTEHNCFTPERWNAANVPGCDSKVLWHPVSIIGATTISAVCETLEPNRKERG